MAGFTPVLTIPSDNSPFEYRADIRGKFGDILAVSACCNNALAGAQIFDTKSHAKWV
jgi:hypothetical protein